MATDTKLAPGEAAKAFLASMTSKPVAQLLKSLGAEITPDPTSWDGFRAATLTQWEQAPEGTPPYDFLKQMSPEQKKLLHQIADDNEERIKKTPGVKQANVPAADDAELKAGAPKPSTQQPAPKKEAKDKKQEHPVASNKDHPAANSGGASHSNMSPEAKEALMKVLRPFLQSIKGFLKGHSGSGVFGGLCQGLADTLDKICPDEPAKPGAKTGEPAKPAHGSKPGEPGAGNTKPDTKAGDPTVAARINDMTVKNDGTLSGLKVQDAFFGDRDVSAADIRNRLGLKPGETIGFVAHEAAGGKSSYELFNAAHPDGPRIQVVPQATPTVTVAPEAKPAGVEPPKPAATPAAAKPEHAVSAAPLSDKDLAAHTKQFTEAATKELEKLSPLNESTAKEVLHVLSEKTFDMSEEGKARFFSQVDFAVHQAIQDRGSPAEVISKIINGTKDNPQSGVRFDVIENTGQEGHAGNSIAFKTDPVASVERVHGQHINSLMTVDLTRNIGQDALGLMHGGTVTAMKVDGGHFGEHVPMNAQKIRAELGDGPLHIEAVHGEHGVPEAYLLANSQGAGIYLAPPSQEENSAFSTLAVRVEKGIKDLAMVNARPINDMSLKVAGAAPK